MEKINYFIVGFGVGVAICTLYSTMKSRKHKIISTEQ